MPVLEDCVTGHTSPCLSWAKLSSSLSHHLFKLCVCDVVGVFLVVFFLVCVCLVFSWSSIMIDRKKVGTIMGKLKDFHALVCLSLSFWNLLTIFSEIYDA